MTEQKPFSMDDIYDLVDWMEAGSLDDGTEDEGQESD